jgi:hypothetical protein
METVIGATNSLLAATESKYDAIKVLVTKAFIGIESVAEGRSIEN